jgi:hypothetical protein
MSSLKQRNNVTAPKITLRIQSWESVSVSGNTEFGTTSILSKTLLNINQHIITLNICKLVQETIFKSTFFNKNLDTQKYTKNKNRNTQIIKQNIIYLKPDSA